MFHFLVGLGNPGPRYARTRHNLGYMLVDHLADQAGASFQPGKGDFLFCQAGGYYLVKPTTFMNLSGIAVFQLLQLFGGEPGHMLVAYDDCDIPLGTIRLRLSGSAGTHRGMESVIYHLGTEEIPRLRMGTGPRPDGADLSDFVLSDFPSVEHEAVGRMVKAAARCVEVYSGNPALAVSECGSLASEEEES